MHHAYIDKFAYQDSPVHRLDPRMKFIAAIIFTAFVISLPRHAVALPVCCITGPFVVLVIGKTPLRFVLKHIAITSPLIAVLAASCIFYDRAVVDIVFGPFSWQSTAGALRAASIVIKFTVTMMTLTALVSTTRFSDLLAAIQKLGIPQVLIMQIAMLYRYIFLIIDNAAHILQARSCRKLRNLGFKTELKVAAAMVGTLLVTSFNQAHATSLAMQARSFDGKWRTLSHMKLKFADAAFAAAFIIFIAVMWFLAAPRTN
ncbi:MAG: cobalt ECF transporter T component CbiQ [Planctomycetota bacterium]